MYFWLELLRYNCTYPLGLLDGWDENPLDYILGENPLNYLYHPLDLNPNDCNHKVCLDCILDLSQSH